MIRVNELPHGWIKASIKEISDGITKGTTPTSVGFDFQSTGVRFVKVESLSGQTINHKKCAYISEQANQALTRSKLQEDDILFSIAGTLGRVAVVHAEDVPANTNQALAIIRLCKGPIPDFVAYYLSTFARQSRMSELGRGVGLQNLNLQQVSSFSVLLPPVNEQRRIVAKLEESLASVDTCRKRLEQVPRLLKQFRQSVLAAACSGRLTADWREQQISERSAEYRRAAIQKARHEYYRMLCADAEKAGKPKPRLIQEYTKPFGQDGLPKIPNSWMWEYLVNMSHLQGGVTKGRILKGKTIWLPYLRVANVQDGFLNLRDIKTIEVLPEDKEKYHLEKGDILFTEGGDRDKLGRGTVWLNNIPYCIHQNHIFRARLYDAEISPFYISLATKSDYARAYFFRNASQTVNLASMNLTVLGRVPIALPPPDEQREIVRRVEAFFKIADTVEDYYRKAQEQLDKLPQSILAKAFRGELVPQDPTDEPASTLLERIRAEKMNSEKATRRTKQPQRKAGRRPAALPFTKAAEG